LKSILIRLPSFRVDEILGGDAVVGLQLAEGGGILIVEEFAGRREAWVGVGADEGERDERGDEGEKGKRRKKRWMRTGKLRRVLGMFTFAEL